MTAAPVIFWFEISPTTRLELHVVEDPPTIRRFDWSDVWLFFGQEQLLIQKSDELDSTLSYFEESLQAALADRLELSTPLPEDLAVLWSKNFGGIALPPYANYSEDRKSRGNFFAHHFFLPSIWIYTKNGAIHFQVADTYDWSREWPDEVTEMADFEHWVKNYKPIFEFQIGYDQARQWLKTVADIRAQCQPYPSELKAAQDRSQKEFQD